MKSVISCFNLDIQEYLEIINDYGKPNFKYLNFVWNKMGFNFLFYYKEHMFSSKFTAIEFMEESVFALKKMFLEEKLKLKKAAIIFILFKLYYVSNTLNLKIRITLDDWKQFKIFINGLDQDLEYEPIRFMFWNLFADDAFRFVARNYPLGLDIYINKTIEQGNLKQISEWMNFWSSLKADLNEVEDTTVEDIKKLEVTHKKTTESIKDSLPNAGIIDEILKDFKDTKIEIESKNILDNPKSSIKQKMLELETYLEIPSSSGHRKNGSSSDNSSDADSLDELDKTPRFRKKKRGKKTKGRKSQKNKEVEIKVEDDPKIMLTKRNYGNCVMLEALGSKNSVEEMETINQLYE